MSINESLKETQKKVNNINGYLVDIRDVLETMLNHFEGDFTVYESKQEATSDLRLALRCVKDIHNEIFEE